MLFGADRIEHIEWQKLKFKGLFRTALFLPLYHILGFLFLIMKSLFRQMG